MPNFAHNVRVKNKFTNSSFCHRDNFFSLKIKDKQPLGHNGIKWVTTEIRIFNSAYIHSLHKLFNFSPTSIL
jgi:hypothetical protein